MIPSRNATTPFGRSIPRNRARIAIGSRRCIRIRRPTTASNEPGSVAVATVIHEECDVGDAGHCTTVDSHGGALCVDLDPDHRAARAHDGRRKERDTSHSAPDIENAGTFAQACPLEQGTRHAAEELVLQQ